MKDLNVYMNESMDPDVELAYKIMQWTDEKLDASQFAKILGDYEKHSGDMWIRWSHGPKPNRKPGMFCWSYLSNNRNGDYIMFHEEPTRTQLNKCTELLKKILKKNGFGDIDLEFKNREYNEWYQAENTYAVGVDMYIPGRK